MVSSFQKYFAERFLLCKMLWRPRGVRAGNWLTVDQVKRLLDLPDVTTNKGKRDRALLALLVGCGLRGRSWPGSGSKISSSAPAAGALWTWQGRGIASGLLRTQEMTVRCFNGGSIGEKSASERAEKDLFY
jgi:hypothetical protein